jgi:hypothetical protein
VADLAVEPRHLPLRFLVVEDPLLVRLQINSSYQFQWTQI